MLSANVDSDEEFQKGPGRKLRVPALFAVGDWLRLGLMSRPLITPVQDKRAQRAYQHSQDHSWRAIEMEANEEREEPDEHQGAADQTADEVGGDLLSLLHGCSFLWRA
jgi:hypothetical protein